MLFEGGPWMAMEITACETNTYYKYKFKVVPMMQRNVSSTWLVE